MTTLNRQKLSVLITAGPTHEPVDAVRYLANRSSGRLGLALAEAAASHGHRVTLLLGPTPLVPPDTTRMALHRFRTAAELQGLLSEHWPSHDVLLMAAAVADYRPVCEQRLEKIPRQGQRLMLELEATPDLLSELSAVTRPDQTVIGFALEPADRLEDLAKRKLEAKRLNAIVANPLETMDSENITAIVYLRDGRVLTPPRALTKSAFAEWLLENMEQWGQF